MILRSLSFVMLALLPAYASAVELTLPASARQTAGQDLGVDSYALPTAGFDGTEIPARTFEGFVTKQAWRIEGAGVTPLQLVQPLRAELENTGYSILYECSARDCGGFDFRFGTDVITAPDMYVDLDDFRFISAVEGAVDAPKAAISLLVSRSSAASYIQVIQVAVDERNGIDVSKGDEILASTQVGNTPPALQGFESVNKQLDVGGHVILSDLEFKTGSSELGEGPFDSLSNLAAYLSTNAGRKIALVGHTDAEGSLDGNIALSKRRASSVRSRLVDRYGVTSSQLSAEGVGFLSPVASNLTDAGRDANRRVEAVVISTK